MLPAKSVEPINNLFYVLRAFLSSQCKQANHNKTTSAWGCTQFFKPWHLGVTEFIWMKEECHTLFHFLDKIACILSLLHYMELMDHSRLWHGWSWRMLSSSKHNFKLVGPVLDVSTCQCQKQWDVMLCCASSFTKGAKPGGSMPSIACASSVQEVPRFCVQVRPLFDK